MLIYSEKRELLLMGYPAYRDLETYLEEYEKGFAPEPEYYPWVTSSVSNLKLIPKTPKLPDTYKKR